MMYTVLMPISEFMKPINAGPATLLFSVLPSLYPSINFEISDAWSFPMMLSEPVTYRNTIIEVKSMLCICIAHVFYLTEMYVKKNNSLLILETTS